jgi:hypothetical protein
VLFLHHFRASSVLKADIYQNFFEFAPVIAFCDAMGIEPQTVTSAQHRLPFLLNLLDSCGFIEQQINSIELSSTLSPDLQRIIKEIIS